MKTRIALLACILSLTACQGQDPAQMTREMHGFRTYSTPAIQGKIDMLEQGQRAGAITPRPGVTIYPLR